VLSIKSENMLKNLNLRAKVLMILIFISLLTAGVVGTIAFTLGTNTLKEESYQKLTAIREMKANQIENYFNLIYDQVQSFSESRTIIESTYEFKKGFDDVIAETNYTSKQLREIDSALQSYYQLNFLDQLYYQDSVVNYFSIPQKELEKGKSLWLNTAGSSGDKRDNVFPHLNPGTFSQDVKILGSSTVSSLAQHIIDRFKDEGAEGRIEYISTGTSDGIEQLISDKDVALVGTSHALTVDELALFTNSGEEPASFRIGTDAIVVVISQKNKFLYDLSIEELRLAFTTAEKWSDINENWPDEPISRFIPSEGSGSYTTFSNIVLDGDQNSLINSQNIMEIIDGTKMKEAILNDPYTIAFYSYNYFDHDENLRIISIDGVNLDNISVRRDMYPLKRSLFMVTTVNLLSENQHVAHLINYFLNSVAEEIGVSLEKTQYWPQHTNHRVLQYHYLVRNPNQVGEKGELMSSGLDFSYDNAHRKYHPIIKNYLDRFGFYDIFLVDADSGHIIYSVSKEVDFGTDLLRGPYSNTNIAEVYRKVVNNPAHGVVCFEDFAAYPPSYNALCLIYWHINF
jgi:ABC-type phosphate transport system substrate-binding protein